MNELRTAVLLTSTVLLAGGANPGPAAQEVTEEKACAQLLPAIESLKAILVQEARARSAQDETQRMQVVLNLLGLRYRNIQALESSLRDAEAEENEIRGALARSRAQIEALDDAAKSSPKPGPELELKAQRAEIDAVVTGLEERAKGLRDRKATYQGQIALERRDIDKLEAGVRGWLEKAP